MNRNIIVYMHESKWHLNRSDAFLDILINPLNDRFDIEIRNMNNFKNEEHCVHIFLLTIPNIISESNNSIYVWFPMYDNIVIDCAYDFKLIPKFIRIVSMSEYLGELLKPYDLNFKVFKYYKKSKLVELNFSKRICGYWNRVNTYSTKFLEEFCNKLQLDELIVLNRSDNVDIYKIDDLKLNTHTNVVNINECNNKYEYYNIMNKCNIFLAPRRYEGMGLSNIEQFSRGCVVFGINKPTLNEYIDKSTLLSNSNSVKEDIDKLNLKDLSELVLYNNTIGYNKWVENLDNYIDYIVQN